MDTFLSVLNLIIWPTTVLVGVLGVAWLLRYSLTRFTAGGFEVKFNELRREIADIERPQKTQEAIDEKRERLLKIPNVSFHFVDKDRITDFYNDYFREPTIDNVVREMATETSGDLSTKLPQVLEAKAGGKSLSKWISTIKLPDTSLSGMFVKYQRETIKNNQVAVGLEVVEVEFSELQHFESLIDELRTRHEMVLDVDSLNTHRNVLKSKAAERTLIKMERASGWIIVEGNFTIHEEGDFYKCNYTHPITEYIPPEAPKATISFLLPKAHVEPHVLGNYQQSVGRQVPLRVYGEVWQPLDRSQDVWELQITPLAVY